MLSDLTQDMGPRTIFPLVPDTLQLVAVLETCEVEFQQCHHSTTDSPKHNKDSRIQAAELWLQLPSETTVFPIKLEYLNGSEDRELLAGLIARVSYALGSPILTILRCDTAGYF